MSSLTLTVEQSSEVALEVVRRDTSVFQYIKTKLASLELSGNAKDAFYAVNVGQLIKLHEEWMKHLPTVCPFYAVKCNNNPVILKILAALGTGFDCASKNEIETVLDHGAAPDRIIYANPCKQISHLKFAADKGVEMMTFDSEGELYKIKEHFPAARLVLRFRVDDPNAKTPLGAKFGCSIPQGKSLLRIAKDHRLNVIGVSFHVGSGCQTPSTYQTALKMSAELFQYGADIGFDFSLLDIGGGFPGTKDSSDLFTEVTSSINQSLQRLFSSSSYPRLTVIAEPGRYFAASVYAVAVNVINKKMVTSSDGNSNFMYYLNDGIYGTFNFLAFNDHYSVTPLVLKDYTSHRYPTTLWGPTCDIVDKICDTQLPELNQGDWLYFDDIGAYSIAACTTFNGFQKLTSYYYSTEEWEEKCSKLLKLRTYT